MKNRTLKTICKALSENKTTTLTTIGVCGMLVGTVLAVKAAPKANEHKIKAKLEKESAPVDDEKYCQVQDAKKLKNEDGYSYSDIVAKMSLKNRFEAWQLVHSKYDTCELTAFDILKATWKDYVWAAGATVIGATFIFKANSINIKDKAALTAGYALLSNTFDTYKKSVEEHVAPEIKQEIDKSVAKKQIKKAAVNGNTGDDVVLKDDEILCMDAYTGRYFTSTLSNLEIATTKLVRDMCQDTYVSANDWFMKLGLDTKPVFNQLGWNVNKNSRLELETIPGTTESGKPCLVVSLSDLPVAGYDAFL